MPSPADAARGPAFDGGGRAGGARARAAQAVADGYDQARVDELVAAAGWAILEPGRNRELAELAVADTGIGDVEDKVRKNHRKTLGLLRDLQGARTVGVIAEDTANGAGRDRAAGGRGVRRHAVDQSRGHAGQQDHQCAQGAQRGHRRAVAEGRRRPARGCIEFVHAEFDRIGAPRDLVQMLSAPITKEATAELMRQCDLVVATGSQANVRAAYASGTPAFGVGAGNVASIVDETADLEAAAAKIVQSKTFDNATSCSSENSVVLARRGARRDARGARRARQRAARRGATARGCRSAMWPDGKLSPGGHRPAGGPRSRSVRAARGHRGARRPASCWSRRAASAPSIRSRARSSGRCSPSTARAISTQAREVVERIYAYQGAGHSGRLHSAREDARPRPGLHAAGVARDRRTRRTASPPAAASTTACPCRSRWAAAPGAATTSPTTSTSATT